MKENKLKIYIQYPWKFPDSPYYKSLIGYPPQNVKYINVNNNLLITQKNKFFLSNKIKANIRKIIGSLNLPLINAHFTKTDKKYNLIHCAHCLSLNKQPWIADFEGAWQFLVSTKRNKKGENSVKNLLLSPYCKKIMPWTEYTKREILKVFPEKEIQKKIEVVYPAVMPVQKIKKENNKKLTILYVARYFWLKGGIIALETLKRIKQRNDIDIIFISNVPKELQKKYPQISFLDLMPQEKVFDYYKKADIFFYPSFVDTFGFALLEAMAFGLPIITINTNWTKTRKEIIKNGYTGLMFDVFEKINQKKVEKREKRIINLLIRNIEKLIKNKKLREKMSKNCLNEIKNGKFSIKQRNKQLERIYGEAIK